MKRTAILLSTLAIATFGATAFANAEHHPQDEAVAKAAPSQALSEGTVRKVDKENAKLTIKHGPLENLGMPGMTMIFHVKDPAMLDQVKAGDAIRFRAEQVDGNLTVTRIEPVR